MTHTIREGATITHEEALLKVANGSPAPKVAGSIVKNMEEGKRVVLLAMGAGAVNQAVKAIAIARGMAAPKGWNLSCIPAFTDEDVEGVVKTAIKFIVVK